MENQNIKKITNNLIIEFHVPDFTQVKKFYTKLGFNISMEDKLNEKEQGYLTMTRRDELGNTLINFYGGDNRVYNQSYFKQFNKETKKGYAIEVTIPVSKINDLYNSISLELKENIVRELKELKDHSHSWKDFRMVDPFGFYIRFTELLDWGQ